MGGDGVVPGGNLSTIFRDLGCAGTGGWEVAGGAGGVPPLPRSALLLSLILSLRPSPEAERLDGLAVCEDWRLTSSGRPPPSRTLGDPLCPPSEILSFRSDFSGFSTLFTGGAATVCAGSNGGGTSLVGFSLALLSFLLCTAPLSSAASLGRSPPLALSRSSFSDECLATAPSVDIPPLLSLMFVLLCVLAGSFILILCGTPGLVGLGSTGLAPPDAACSQNAMMSPKGAGAGGGTRIDSSTARGGALSPASSGTASPRGGAPPAGGDCDPTASPASSRCCGGLSEITASCERRRSLRRRRAVVGETGGSGPEVCDEVRERPGGLSCGRSGGRPRGRCDSTAKGRSNFQCYWENGS